MLNKERIEKKNAEKAERQAEAQAEAPVVAEAAEPVVEVVKKDRSGLKCTDCGRLIVEVEGSGRKHGTKCGDCWRRALAA